MDRFSDTTGAKEVTKPVGRAQSKAERRRALTLELGRHFRDLDYSIPKFEAASAAADRPTPDLQKWAAQLDVALRRASQVCKELVAAGGKLEGEPRDLARLRSRVVAAFDSHSRDHRPSLPQASPTEPKRADASASVEAHDPLRPTQSGPKSDFFYDNPIDGK